MRYAFWRSQVVHPPFAFLDRRIDDRVSTRLHRDERERGFTCGGCRRRLPWGTCTTHRLRKCDRIPYALFAEGRLENCLPGETYHGGAEFFLRAGYEFGAVDALITTVHLPKSSRLVSAGAFLDLKKLLDYYRLVMDEEYHFYGFGDAMFIHRLSIEPRRRAAACSKQRRKDISVCETT